MRTALLFAGLKTVIIDEVHALPPKSEAICCRYRWRGFNASRQRCGRSRCLQRLRTPMPYRAWLAPDGDIDSVTLVEGEAGAPPQVSILIPEDRVPWSGA